MAKSVLQYLPKGIPAKSDIIAYNKETSCWEEVSQSNFLSPVTLKIKQTNSDITKLSEKIDTLEDVIDTLEDKIKYLAELEKENLLW